ncbi:hypothetical protein ACFYO0_10120 [Streptomyces sp. NPDC006365]|uniref:hypothetical protein n=1 Tax=Streptomyces sp. NPDC006365 TaxID=3364744 RepID=UPI0036BBF6B3
MEATVRGGYSPDPSLDGHDTGTTPEGPAAEGPPGGEERTAAEAEAADAAERQTEIKDLTRRVVVGAVLTDPVLFVVMAYELFGADWVPGWMLNHWLQLALITPEMFYTGWPIHVTGRLALRHRAADMNSLIALGTSAAYGYSLLVTLAPGLLPEDVREVYFEAVGGILTLILLGRLLDARAKVGTGEAIRALLGLQVRQRALPTSGSGGGQTGRRRTRPVPTSGSTRARPLTFPWKDLS